MHFKSCSPAFKAVCLGIANNFFANNSKPAHHYSTDTILLLLFLDENFSVPHNKRGVVGMANKGRHTNASQFYITLQPTPWMDTKYVAFG
jgi:cyclophilin family peptidyl-prolyl cis-trans isomerase